MSIRQFRKLPKIPKLPTLTEVGTLRKLPKLRTLPKLPSVPCEEPATPSRDIYVTVRVDNTRARVAMRAILDATSPANLPALAALIVRRLGRDATSALVATVFGDRPSAPAASPALDAAAPPSAILRARDAHFMIGVGEVRARVAMSAVLDQISPETRRAMAALTLSRLGPEATSALVATVFASPALDPAPPSARGLPRSAAAWGTRPCPTCATLRSWSAVRAGAWPLGCAACRPEGPAVEWRLTPEVVS